MFIDTHCHISKDDYDDIDKLIADNKAALVTKIIVSGCEKSNILEVIELSKKYDEIFLTLGYHPEYADLITDDDITQLEKLLSSYEKVVGVGEIGLDYHYSKDNKDKQISLFRKQLDIARKLNLCVVIHSRDALMDTIEVLKDYPDVVGVIHCFSGSLETAKTYISMGFKLGIGGIVTFKNSNLSKVLENIDISNIVFETDSPYLTPEPYRGTKNSSKYIPLIAKKVSDIYNINIDDLSSIVLDNTNSIFKFK